MGISKNRVGVYYAAFLAAVLLLTASGVVFAAPQAANFAGSWQMQMENNRAGAGKAGRGARAQTLTITQDGDKYKVEHKTARADESFDATVSGNTISWTETRARRNGGSVNVAYKATIDGDALQGTMGAGKFSRSFTAKRAS